MLNAPYEEDLDGLNLDMSAAYSENNGESSIKSHFIMWFEKSSTDDETLRILRNEKHKNIKFVEETSMRDASAELNP